MLFYLITINQEICRYRHNKVLSQYIFANPARWLPSTPMTEDMLKARFRYFRQQAAQVDLTLVVPLVLEMPMDLDLSNSIL